MAREDAIRFALSRSPDHPGVGRLCQELLCDLSGVPIDLPPHPPLERRLPGRTYGRRLPSPATERN
jgi:hypothetical protein